VTRWYRQFAPLVLKLTRDEDYEVDEKKKHRRHARPGHQKVEDYLGIDNLYEPANTALIGYLNNAIKAKELFLRDKDYVVTHGEVLIVDEHTGRILPGRRYNEGLHQAIEAKEGVEVKAENQTFATITLQNYFRMYDKLAGMTGTAETEAAEFMGTYKLGVLPIPTNKPMIRKDQDDLIYRTKKEKLAAIVKDVAKRHAKGQPVLLGTASVESSEVVSSLLDVAKIPHQVLNAKQHEKEAEPSSPSPAARAPSPWPPTWPAVVPTSCSAATSSSSPMRSSSPKGYSPETPRTSTRSVGRRTLAEDQGPGQGRARGGRRARRPVRARHRAPRIPPYRQPAARPFRPSGRSG
jgi:preprotein translocase subunit SecA